MQEELISVTKAEELILKESLTFKSEKVGIFKSIGRVLNEEIKADRDFPPFNRVMMDGIAIRHSSLEAGQHKFKITGFQAAGTIQQKLVEDRDCIEVMTGSMMPMDADTVVPYERIKLKNNIALVEEEVIIFKGQNVHLQGSDRKRGEPLIKNGVKISPAEIGILATVGKAEVDVLANPNIAIISTGDELVDVEDMPAPHQIRKSNSISIWSSLKEKGIESDILHLPDQRDEIKATLEGLLEKYDVILMSGGVSKGKKDFIPDVLEELKVNKSFHGVEQRPGKPFWFGRRKDTVIFSFPGNPVSTFLCLYRYFFPWYKKSLGLSQMKEIAILSEDFEFKPQLTYFLQVKIQMDLDGKLLATPSIGNGSGDLANLAEADGFLELPADKESFIKGGAYPLIRYRF